MEGCSRSGLHENRWWPFQVPLRDQAWKGLFQLSSSLTPTGYEAGNARGDFSLQATTNSHFPLFLHNLSLVGPKREQKTKKKKVS